VKRYRVLNIDFDARANMLNIKIEDWWEPQVKQLHQENRLSFNAACELGFRGSLDEWERLMGAVARR
jgi:hypothetical protein